MKIIFIFLLLAGLATLGLIYLVRENIIFISDKMDEEHRNATLEILQNRLSDLQFNFDILTEKSTSLNLKDQNKLRVLSRNIEALESIIDELSYTQDIARWKVLRRKFFVSYNDAVRNYRNLAKTIGKNS